MCLPQASPPHAAPVPPASTAAGVSAARSDCHTPAQGAAPLLALEGLSVFFRTDQGLLPAVQGLSLQVAAGAATCLVGESGCGKSLTARAVLRLLPENAVQRGRVLLEGTDLAACTGRELRRVRGRRVGMVFQEPMTALNPVLTVGSQVAEPLRLHLRLPRAAARREATALLAEVGIPDPHSRYNDYPHQLSGGLRQRICIAMAMVLHPEFLIADEPTTALDVTVEAQILALMKHLQQKNHTSILMITHNLGVVADICDEVNVMYAGQIVEHAQKAELFRHPAHPYTQGLMKAVPRIHGDNRGELFTIEGTVPPLRAELPGCRFAERCPYATQQCRTQAPQLRIWGTAIWFAASERRIPNEQGSSESGAPEKVFQKSPRHGKGSG